MSTREIGARNLLVEFLGAFVRGLDNWFPVAPVVDLMGHVGMDEASVRMAISRLKTRGWLAPERRAGKSGYRLTDTALELLAEGDTFIYGLTMETDLTEGWTIVAFSIPEQQRAKRHALKSRLVDGGFGHTGPGLLVAPARMLHDARRIVRELGVSEFVELFTAHYEGDDLNRFISRGWDIAKLGQRYERFLALTEPILSRWSRADDQSPPDALNDYLAVLHEWRLITYSDPRLPSNLLGAKWPGDQARAVFEALVAALHPRASALVETRIEETVPFI